MSVWQEDGSRLFRFRRHLKKRMQRYERLACDADNEHRKDLYRSRLLELNTVICEWDKLRGQHEREVE